MTEHERVETFVIKSSETSQERTFLTLEAAKAYVEYLGSSGIIRIVKRTEVTIVKYDYRELQLYGE